MSELMKPKIELNVGSETAELPDSLEVNELYWHIRENGQSVDQNGFDWKANSAILMLIETQGAKYLVEPQQDSPALVTRVNDDTLCTDARNQKFAAPFLRCEAWPDQIINIGQELTFSDINRSTRKLDPGTRYQTSPVRDIKFLL